jgi:RND superfamily putative drug exporter
VTERLAVWSSRRPWVVLGAWALALISAAAINASFLGDAISGDEEVTSRTESRRANELQHDRFPQRARAQVGDVSEVVVVRSNRSKVEEVPFRLRVEQISAALRRAGASRVTSYYDVRDQRLVSADRKATVMLVALGSNPDDRIDSIVDAVQNADGMGGFDVSITGEETLDADFSTLAEEDLRNGELRFGMPAALVVLLAVFGSVVAGLIPVLMAIVSIAVAFALIALVGQVFPLSVFATNMLTGMGLALGIDYSLFVLSRYREERRRGSEQFEAITIVGATASRAVLFSGIAFTLAMVGLLLVPHTLMRSLACGAIAAGLVSIAAGITLLPALLGLLGDRVNAWRVPLVGRGGGGEESRFWSRAVDVVMRRPLASLVLVTTVLLALAIPVLSLHSGEAGVSTLPDRLAAKQGYRALNEAFPGETTNPVEVVIDGDTRSPAVRKGIARLGTELAEEPVLGRVSSERNAAGDLTVLTVPIRGDADSREAFRAVRRLRSEIVPAAFADPAVEALVTGETAEDIDATDTMNSWLPAVFAFVLGLSFVLLTVAFRSLVVAAKAIAINLLSVGAAYGLMVLVFQEGVASGFFGFQQIDTIQHWVPLFLFAVLFGLSMDYHVFLLSRIRERYNATSDNDDAIRHGVASTGRTITGAALIIIAVFSGFAAGDLVMFQQMGFGVGVALLLDATVVRLILVPAAMKLLGLRNWYLPSWLGWLPDVRIEGGATRR